MEGQKKISLHISLFFKSQARRKGKQIWNSFSVYPKKIKKNWKKLCFCQNLLAPQNQGKIVLPLPLGHFSKSPICKACTLTCNAAPCKPCTLQALKALFRGSTILPWPKHLQIPSIYILYILKSYFPKICFFYIFPRKKREKSVQRFFIKHRIFTQVPNNHPPQLAKRILRYCK